MLAAVAEVSVLEGVVATPPLTLAVQMVVITIIIITIINTAITRHIIQILIVIKRRW